MADEGWRVEEEADEKKDKKHGSFWRGLQFETEIKGRRREINDRL